MFDFDFPEITDEMIAALPESQRPMWEQLRTAKADHARYVAECVERREFGQALLLTDSKERAQVLVGWDEDDSIGLTDADVATLIRDYWSVTEAWSGDVRLRDGMMRLLRRVAPIQVLDEVHQRPLPDGAITIYRGNLGEQPGTGSWTLDPAIAEKFASMAMSIRGKFLGMHRADGVPSVWRATAFADAVLGYFDDRDEQECVIEAEHLRNVTLWRQAVSA